MKNYKGCFYFLDKDGFWKVKLNDDSVFVVALDDSKLDGYKKLLLDRNNEESCKEYIDLIVSK